MQVIGYGSNPGKEVMMSYLEQHDGSAHEKGGFKRDGVRSSVPEWALHAPRNVL